MYKYANKHIELFKQIPFEKFAINADLIHKLIENPGKYGTYENILKVYYFIADEMWDSNNTKPLIEYDSNESLFRFYDFVRKRQTSLKTKYYKQTKLFNGILGKDDKNSHFRKSHGLMVKNKPNVSKKEIQKQKDLFIQYANVYNQNYQFYKRNKFEFPDEWGEHLYMLLNQLCENAIFFYKQPGSFILAQEMVSVFSNQFAVQYALSLIIQGHDRNKIIRQLKEKKQFMFGELQHDVEKYKETKRILKKQKRQQNQLQQ